MLCTNCGKDIPFVGKVCPWCHHGKAGDQAVQIFGLIGGLLGAGIGYMIGGILGAAIGGIAGAVVVLGLFGWSDVSSTLGEYQDAKRSLEASLEAIAAGAQVAPDSLPPDIPSPNTGSGAVTRLHALDELKRQGLISEVELEAKRRQIIDDL